MEQALPAWAFTDAPELVITFETKRSVLTKEVTLKRTRKDHRHYRVLEVWEVYDANAPARRPFLLTRPVKSKKCLNR